MTDDPLGDFSVGWAVFFTRERQAIEPKTKAKFSAGQQHFRTAEEANAYKAELQANGYIASVKPLHRSPKERERLFKRQRQTSLADDWPLQARPPGRK
jgi:hypothetical protein